MYAVAMCLLFIANVTFLYFFCIILFTDVFDLWCTGTVQSSVKPKVVHIPPSAPTEHIADVQQKTRVCSRVLLSYNLHILSCYLNDLGRVAQTELNLAINEASINFHTHTHKHNHCTALWNLSGTTWVSWYQKVHFAIFWIFRCKMKITQADAPIIRMDCHPIRTNCCPISAIPTIFTPYALRSTTLPIYPGLEQAPNMLPGITSGLVTYVVA